MRLDDEIARVQRFEIDEEPPPNEACTCDWVIRPLLDAAGYGYRDIHPQHSDAAGGVPDFTVLAGTPHTWFLEAKAWAVQLQDQHAIQALNYAHTHGARWVVLTNGHEWRLYDDHVSGVPPGERLVATAHFADQASVQALIQALSKVSVQAGELARFASNQLLRVKLDAALVDPKSDIVRLIARTYRQLGVHPDDVVEYFRAQQQVCHSRRRSGLQAPAPPVPVAPPPGQEPETESQSLQAMARKPELVTRREPERVVMPDGTELRATTWVGLSCELVMWISRSRPLPTLPFRAANEPGYCFLNTEPRHPGGAVMSCAQALETPAGRVFLHGRRTASHFARSLADLCAAVGVDASGVSVYLRARAESASHGAPSGRLRRRNWR